MSETNRPTASHDEIRARLSAWLDDDLDAVHRTEVSLHLRGCAACRALVGDLERIREEARALPAYEPERDLWPGIRAAMGNTGADRARARDDTPLPLPRVKGSAGGVRGRGGDGVPIASGAPRRPAARGATVRRAHQGGLLLTLPQLAAAALVVLAIGVSGGWWLAPAASAESPGLASPTATEASGGPPSDEVGPGPTATDGTGGGAARVALPAEAREFGEEAEDLRADFEERSRALDRRTVRTVGDNLAAIDRAIQEAETAYLRSPESAYLERHLVESYRRKVTYLRDAVAVTSWSADG